MPNPKNRYSADRSRQRSKAAQQKRPATSPATPLEYAAPEPMVEPRRPAPAAISAPVPASRPATRPVTGARARTPSGGRSTRAISGLNTNWLVVRRDLRRIGLIAGGMIAFLVVLSFLLPALRII